MHHIIYISSAVALLDRDELNLLLEQSREGNFARGVTGLLLYNDGHFLQVLEGEKAVVDELYSKITRDARHCRCTPLFKEPIAEREFGDWSMAFRDLTTEPAEAREGFNDLLNHISSAPEFSIYPDKVRAFMRMFAGR